MPVQNAMDPAAALKFVESSEAKIDAIMQKLAQTPEEQLTIRTIPAVTVGRGPDGDIAPATGNPQPALVSPAPATHGSASAPVRNEAETFDRVARFLDPTQLGPLFVSKPIRERVFFGIYPSFAEILSSERVLGITPDNVSVEVNNMWIAAGELGIAIKGFLRVNDPGIEQILTNPGAPGKWPALKRFSVTNNRDPNFGTDLVALWNQYSAWKREVTPTEDELGFYYTQSG